MEKGTFITYEQALNQNKLIPVAEAYEKQIQDILMIFAKDTLLQIGNMDLYFDAMELYGVYKDKDYSRYLFTKTEEIFNEVSKITSSEGFQKAKEALSSFSKIYTETAMKADKALKEAKDKIKEQGGDTDGK